MRGLVIVVTLLALLTVGAVSAASLLEFDRWMQKIERRSLGLQRSLKKKDAATAIEHGRELVALYEQMEQFFVHRSEGQDALRWTRDGIGHAQRAAAAAQRQDFSAALRSMQALTEDCRACHLQYKPLD